MTRVIVADDDRVSSHLLCAILRRRAFVPEPAYDIPALFAACARAPAPVAILLDMHMPGGTGAEAIRRLKADPALTGVRVIVVSGSSNDAEQAEALSLGIAAFLGKPVDPAALLAALG